MTSLCLSLLLVTVSSLVVPPYRNPQPRPGGLNKATAIHEEWQYEYENMQPPEAVALGPHPDLQGPWAGDDEFQPFLKPLKGEENPHDSMIFLF